MQVVNHLRRQGFFVAVALTRPFGFEGQRKLEQADTLVEALEQVAHLVVCGWKGKRGLCHECFPKGLIL